MTEPKEKTLIQRGDYLYCTECDCVWLRGENERHDSKCVWYVKPVEERAQEFVDLVQKVGEQYNVFGPDLAMGQSRIATPVVPAGWVCSRCQRVFAPHVSECPHCQPGICSTGGA